jgi:hypothetical protein
LLPIITQLHGGERMKLQAQQSTYSELVQSMELDQVIGDINPKLNEL